MDAMIDDELDEPLRDALRDYNRPPEVPREAMWARIEAGRRERHAPRQAARVYRLPRQVVWGVGLAATLALGIGIGRYMDTQHATGGVRVATGPSTSAAQRGGAREAAAPNVERPAPSTAYRLATIEHLSRTEALLTTLHADARAGRSDSTVDAWARDLLGTTRMLLDSPAANDPQLGTLLSDLELVLAQIAALPSTHDRKDIELIDDAVRQHAVLTRLRMTVPAGPIRTGT
jgi:hypothetical protein